MSWRPPPTRRWLGRSALGAATLVLVLVLSVVAVLMSLYVHLRFRHRIYSPAEVPHADVAIVFGAGLAGGGEPSRLLAQRLDVGLDLYKRGRVRSLLVSGDSSDRYHDEASAMRRYLVSRGVPERDVLPDFYGVSTYDTCARAAWVYGVGSATLVTQRFHLPRALFIANTLGLPANGVPAALGGTPRDEAREAVSRVVALVMVILRPKPHSLEAAAR